VKGGVEGRDLGQPRVGGAHGVDAGQGRGVVQRGELGQPRDRGPHGAVDDHRAIEDGAAVDDAVAHRVHRGQRARTSRITSTWPAGFGPDPRLRALIEGLRAVDVEDRPLEAARAGVQDQDSPQAAARAHVARTTHVSG
jgi:hypothetical protein